MFLTLGQLKEVMKKLALTGDRFYNGVTLDDIHGSSFEKGCTTKDGSSTVNGIQAIAEQGIVGRGVLLDFHSWRLAQDPLIPYEPFQTGSIPLKYLIATAKAQGTEIKFGDILIIRSGEFCFLSHHQLLPLMSTKTLESQDGLC
jgi:hypothetical protein